MIGGKTNSAMKPTALGTMLNAATYGATKPTIIGTTRSTLLAIWAANIRKGHSGKKGKKGKGPPTYVENIDFLVGSNPIEGCLQVWTNNTNRYTMDFEHYRVSPGASFFTVPDARLYFVLGVTAEVDLNGTFNDYGDPSSGGIGTCSVNVGGTGYAIGDTFSVDGGATPAIGTVVSVTGFANAVNGFIFNVGGQGYTPGGPVTTTTLTGGGSGLTINILTTAARSYGGTYEHPLWNIWQPGPDLVNAGYAREYPWVFNWQPGSALIRLPYYQNFLAPTNGLPNGNGFINVYYFRLTRASGLVPPIQYNRMAFEQVLGSGTEYANAGLSAQQDLHPCDAGLGSSDIDLGSAAMIPDFRVEVKGSHCRWPHGDSDFVDMIDDTFKSGQRQVLSQLGLIQRGVNCNDLPGIVQKAMYLQLEPTSTYTLPFTQSNNVGSLILNFTRWREGAGGTNPTISDAAADTWIPIMLGNTVGFWYATSVGAAAGNGVTTVWNGVGGFAFDIRTYNFEMDPGSNEVENTAVTQGVTVGATTISLSITVTRPSYILLAAECASIDNTDVPPHWQSVIPNLNPQSDQPLLCKRYVAAAGTYTVSFPIAATTGYNIAMIAMAGQPSPWPKALGNILDEDSLQLARQQCWAGGLIGSVTMNSQRKASEWLTEFLQCANSAFVWSGFVGKVIPRSEVSAAGGGIVYISPTASGPIATLTENDLIGDANTSPVVIKRKAQVDANNIDKLEFCDRGNDYNTSTASQPESAAITFAGPRSLPPTLLHEIQDPLVARKILAISVRRKTHLLNNYTFTMTQKWVGLEAMDLIRIPDPNNLLSYIDVRLTKVTENDDRTLACEADPFIYGLNAPDLNLTVTTVAPNNFDSGIVPALVNPPIFLEPPTAMTVNNAQELWIPVSDSDPDYGGCFVFVSVDGGTSYGATPIATVFGGAVTGVLTQDWPAGLDPDTVNDLKVDLTESLGTLDSFPVSDMNNFVHPVYVEGATTCGYELAAYSTATLTATNKYTIPASPNGIRRDVYHQPLTGSVDHPNGKRFAFLGAASVASPTPFGDGSGIAKLAMQPLWVGQTLFFKFQGFNALGGGVQDIATCIPYSYTPGNCAIIPAPEIVTISVTSVAGPGGNFTVAHGLLATPLFAVIQMTSSGMIVLQRPLSVDATNVYLTATDVGLTANVSFFYAPADASVALSPAVGGAFTVPHGLASTPTLGIVQMDSLGDIWKGGTPYTSTNLNLVASDGPLTGKDYAWVTPPRTPTLTRFVAVALAPGAGGNFSVPHGLGVVPKLIIVRMSSGGAIWLQVAGAISADITNLLLTASDSGITGEAEVWA